MDKLDGGKLDGWITVVTGGDSGMGRAIAEVYAREGADVAIVFHSDAKGAAETLRLVEQAGRRGLTAQVDVRDSAAVNRFFDEVRSRLGMPYVLVNNAGIGGAGAPVADLSDEKWDAAIRTDLYGPFHFARRFVQMRRLEGGGGRIINITSVHEAIPSPNDAAYGAAKGGLLTFTRTLALEVAPQKITVNAIAPGMIATPMTADRTQDPAKLKEAASRIPLGRPGEPWEVAELALYLASNAAGYVTGQSFTIDGGLEMNWGQGA
jgi:glucose 1-dehydrogenase